jgi:hypothetical protein
MSNILFSMATAPRTRSLAANPCMRPAGDTSAIAPVSVAQRSADALTHVGFKQGRLPRGVPR